MRIWLKDSSFRSVTYTIHHSKNTSHEFSRTKTLRSHRPDFASGKGVFARQESSRSRTGEARKSKGQEVPLFDSLTRKFAERRRAAEDGKNLLSEASRPSSKKFGTPEFIGRRGTIQTGTVTLRLPTRASERRAKTTRERAVAVQIRPKKLERKATTFETESPGYREVSKSPSILRNGPLIRKKVSKLVIRKTASKLVIRKIASKLATKELLNTKFLTSTRPGFNRQRVRQQFKETEIGKACPQQIGRKFLQRPSSNTRLTIDHKLTQVPAQNATNERSRLRERLRGKRLKLYDKDSAAFTGASWKPNDTKTEHLIAKAQSIFATQGQLSQQATSNNQPQGSARVSSQQSNSILDIDTEDLRHVDLFAQSQPIAVARRDQSTPREKPRRELTTFGPDPSSSLQTYIDPRPSPKEPSKLALHDSSVPASGRSSRFAKRIESHLLAHDSKVNNEDHSLPLEKPRQVQEPLLPAKESLINAPNSVNEETDRTSRTQFYNPATAAMLTYMKIITTPTADTPGTLVELSFGDKRYLIGQVHEGAQRALLENKAKLAKFSDIFVTGFTEWATTGGILGCMLSMADVMAASTASYTSDLQEKIQKLEAKLRNCESPSGTAKQISSAEKLADQLRRQIPENQRKLSIVEKPHIRVHGPANLTYLLASSRRFILRTSMHVEALEHDSQPASSSTSDRPPDWSDDRVQVWALPVAADVNPSPKSPRKRSFAEYAFRFYEEDDLSSSERTRKDSAEILDHVFNSSWTRKELRQSRLADIDSGTKMYLKSEDSDEFEPVSKQEAMSRTQLDNPTVWISKPWPAHAAPMPKTRPHLKALSYVFKTYPQRGKFLAPKARALGVKDGKDFGRLVSGESVISESGATITPEMVLEESQPSRGIAVVDLPSVEYIAAFVKRPEWVGSFCLDIDAFLWILGPGVILDDRIDRMMRDRGSAQHIVSSPETSTDYLAMGKAASQAIRLNQIDPDHFPIPHHHSFTGGDTKPLSPGSNASAYIPVQRGLTFHLKPPRGLLDDEVNPMVDAGMVLADTPETALILARDGVNNVSSSASRENDLPSRNAEISFLGTGSAVPSMHRNVSGTLLRVPGSGSYLFDCGEGTLGQLRRTYPPDQLSGILRDLRMIWISHMHADHHLGITSVIKAWYQEVHGSHSLQDEAEKGNQRLADSNPEEQPLMNKQICVIGTHNMALWLEEWSRAEDFGFRGLFTVQVDPSVKVDRDPCRLGLYHFSVSSNISSSNSSSRASSPRIFRKKVSRTIFHQFGITDLQTCLVSHCYAAHAVSMTFPSGFKFSYSGDCRPSKEFARIGKDSTVLVHEATFDDEMRVDAKKKKHSTTSEAIAIGLAMKARRIMLTHFSQRYQKLPVIRQQCSLDQIPTEEGSEGQADAAETQDDGPSADETVTEHKVDATATHDDGLAIDENSTEAPTAVDESVEAPTGDQVARPIELVDEGITAVNESTEAVVEDREAHLTKAVNEDVKKSRRTVTYDMYGRGNIENTEPRSDIYTDRIDTRNKDTKAVIETRSAQVEDKVTPDNSNEIRATEPCRPVQDVENPMEPEPSTSTLQNAKDNTKAQLKPTETHTPSPTADEAPYDVKIGVAFDYMRVKVKDIEHLHHFHPAINELFAAQEDGEESLTNEEINRRKKAKKTLIHEDVAAESRRTKAEVHKPAIEEHVKGKDPVIEQLVKPMPAYPAFASKSNAEEHVSESAAPVESEKQPSEKPIQAQPMPEYPKYTHSTSKKPRSVTATPKPGTLESSRILEALNGTSTGQDTQGEEVPEAKGLKDTTLADAPNSDPAVKDTNIDVGDGSSRRRSDGRHTS